MIYRPFWIVQLMKAWESRSLVWLSGVRRSGKTSLSKMLPEAVYYNCDLPSVARQLNDPEYFFKGQPHGATLIFDEIHRLDDPSLVLKIGVDEFPHLKILATGSSTLSATKKFRDSLTGRKINLYLPPVLWNECTTGFNITNLDTRLIRGGLPEFLLDESKNLSLFSEWIDSYYARDIQELFQVRNRVGFLKLLKMLFMQSGGMLEVSNLTKACALSRPTVLSHIESLMVAHAIYLVAPFFGGGSNEIVKRPKVYAFDTGFVTFVNGWNEIRDADRGLLWEHLVLDMLRVKFGEVFYWRDKDNAEVDFVIKGEADENHVFECKINPEKISVIPVKKFRKNYPTGKNYCICPHIGTPYQIQIEGLEVRFISSLWDY
jgi:uncharacterized protein